MGIAKYRYAEGEEIEYSGGVYIRARQVDPAPSLDTAVRLFASDNYTEQMVSAKGLRRLLKGVDDVIIRTWTGDEGGVELFMRKWHGDGNHEEAYALMAPLLWNRETATRWRPEAINTAVAQTKAASVTVEAAPVMTNAEAVAKLKSLGVDRADEVLCDLLGSLGYGDVVEAYGRLFDFGNDDDKEGTEQ
jgi:hypothetical protein